MGGDILDPEITVLVPWKLTDRSRGVETDHALGGGLVAAMPGVSESAEVFLRIHPLATEHQVGTGAHVVPLEDT